MNPHLRWLFGLAVAWGVMIFWIAPHPPMVDFPQHAGQVHLWRELLLDRSPFANDFQINLLTPYVVAYGSALALSVVMPVAIALKLVLSIAYVAFIAMCIALRKRFGGDPRLDWLFLIGFFGVAYRWGLLSFLVAAPICLLFILLADTYAQTPSRRSGVRLVAGGVLLLLSHGLAFLFGLGVGGALLIAALRKRRHLEIAAWTPLALLALFCVGYLMLGRMVDAQLHLPDDRAFEGGWGLQRLYLIPTFAVGTPEDRRLTAMVGALFLAPWLVGARPVARSSPSWWVLGLLICVLALVPGVAARTGLLYERFALFLLPAYAWVFAAGDVAGGRWRPGPRLQAVGVVLMIVTCFAAMTTRTAHAFAFREETVQIDAAIDRLEPGQRALSLVFDPGSRAANSWHVYLHYGVWYQSMRNALVDFNFAWYPPQVVRYRPGRQSAIMPTFEQKTHTFDWTQLGVSRYRYIIVRHTAPLQPDLFKGADCVPAVIETMPGWTIFERPCR